MTFDTTDVLSVVYSNFCTKNNKLSIKYQSYPTPRKIDAYVQGQEICCYHNPNHYVDHRISQKTTHSWTEGGKELVEIRAAWPFFTQSTFRGSKPFIVAFQMCTILQNKKVLPN